MSKCRHEAWEHLPSGRRICADCRASLSPVQPVTPDRLEEMAQTRTTITLQLPEYDRRLEQARREGAEAERARAERIIGTAEDNHCHCSEYGSECYTHDICDEILRRLKAGE